MARLIWWVLVGALIWWGLLKKTQSSRKVPQAQPAPDKHLAPSVMVVCAQCGLHLPQEDAIPTSTGNTPLFFCSAPHAQQHRRENNRTS